MFSEGADSFVDAYILPPVDACILTPIFYSFNFVDTYLLTPMFNFLDTYLLTPMFNFLDRTLDRLEASSNDVSNALVLCYAIPMGEDSGRATARRMTDSE